MGKPTGRWLCLAKWLWMLSIYRIWENLVLLHNLLLLRLYGIAECDNLSERADARAVRGLPRVGENMLLDFMLILSLSLHMVSGSLYLTLVSSLSHCVTSGCTHSCVIVKMSVSFNNVLSELIFCCVSQCLILAFDCGLTVDCKFIICVSYVLFLLSGWTLVCDSICPAKQDVVC